MKDNILFLSSWNQVKTLDKYSNSFSEFDIIILENELLKRKNEIKLNNNTDIFFIDEVLNKDDEEIWIESLEKAGEFFSKCKSYTIKSKGLFNDLLSYNNHSLLEIGEIQYFSAHSEVLNKIFIKITKLSYLFKSNDFHEIIISGPISDWEKLISVMCKEKYKIINLATIFDRAIYCIKKSSIKRDFNILNLKVAVYIPFFLIPPILFSRYILFFLEKVVRNINKPKSELEITNNIDICFYLLHSKFEDVTLPLIKEIQELYQLNTLLITPRHYSTNNGYINACDSIFFEDYLNLQTIVKSIVIYIKTIFLYMFLKYTRKFNKLYVCNGVNLGEIIKYKIDETMFMSFKDIVMIRLTSEFVEKHRVKLFVAPHFSENQIKSISAGCKENNVPFIGMFRGYTGSSTREYGLSTCDYLFVSGEQSKETFARWGVNQKNIIVTGMPIFNKLLELLINRELTEKKIRNYLNVKDYETVVVYLTESRGGRYEYNEREETVKKLFTALKKINDIFLIVKIHPTESETEVYERYIKLFGIKRYHIVRNEVSLDEVIVTSKFAITKDSTTAFNALIAGCKLIKLNFDGSQLFSTSIPDNSIMYVEDEEHLLQALDCTANTYNEHNTANNLLLQHYFYDYDKNPIKNMAKAIHKIFNCNNNEK